MDTQYREQIDRQLCANCGGTIKWNIAKQRLECASCRTPYQAETTVDKVEEHEFADYTRREGERVSFPETTIIACEGCGVCAWVCPRKAAALLSDRAGSLRVYRGERTFATAQLRMGRGNSGKLVAEVKSALQKAAPEAELAVIDGSPGIGCPVISSVSGVHLALIVAEPSLSGRSDLERLLKTAAALRVRTAVCVNKWDVSPRQTEEIEVLCRERGVPFVGKIPFDPQAAAAINSGRSVAALDCPARDALFAIYQQVVRLLAEI